MRILLCVLLALLTTGVTQYSSEPLDAIPTLEVMKKRNVGWTGTFCTLPVLTDHGVRLFPGCANNHDCVTHFARGTRTRTDPTNGAVHMKAIEHSGWLQLGERVEEVVCAF